MLTEYRAPKWQNKTSLEISRSLGSIYEKRRTVRNFSQTKPDEEIILNAIDAARFSPSGANKQPWSFCLIKADEIKKEIRQLSEKEERKFYYENPNEKWVKDLKHLHTNDTKEFLTDAPYLIVIFYRNSEILESGERSCNYYAKESVGIATGMLISALHLCGLSTLTYTPSRMQFLSTLLNRPKEERAFMLLATGLPKDETKVPMIEKKTLDQILTIYP